MFSVQFRGSKVRNNEYEICNFRCHGISDRPFPLFETDTSAQRVGPHIAVSLAVGRTKKRDAMVREN
jgi:hypothetical protein